MAAKMTAVSRRWGTWGGMGQPGKGSYLIDRSTHSVLLTSMENKLALHFSHYKFGTSCYNQALVNPFALECYCAYIWTIACGAFLLQAKD